MKLLVDTSAWSLLLRRNHHETHPIAAFLKKQIEQDVPLHLSGIIFQEILQGVRSQKQFKELKSYLLDFNFLTATPKVHEEASHLFNLSRKKGIQSHTTDCLIAALAIHYHCHLLTTDRDFTYLAEFTSLKLASQAS